MTNSNVEDEGKLTPATATVLVGTVHHVQSVIDHLGVVRQRNFNFHVILSGFLVTGQIQLQHAIAPALGLVGGVASAMFFALDVRTYALQRHKMEQLYELEPILWRAAGIVGWSPFPSQPFFMTHRFIYRTFFVIVGAFSGALSFVGARGVLPSP